MRSPPGRSIPVVLSILAAWVATLLCVPALEGELATTGECTLRNLPGQGICVCLESSTADLRNVRLLLDGRPVGAPTAGTSRALFFQLPPDVALGGHEVGWAGTGGDGEARRTVRSCTVEAIRILAELDQERIWQGQGTPLRIEVEGTRQPVRLRLLNESPGIVTLEGGARQEVATSGGRRNTLERRVRGVTRGDFDLRWELLDASCPCEEFPGEGVFTGGEPPAVEVPSDEPPPPPTEPPSTEPRSPSVERPSPTVPVTTPPVTTPWPEEPSRRPCASIGEEIERIQDRYASLTAEMTFDTVPRPTVVQTGPTGHEYCDRTYTTWARGSQAVSVHRLMTQVKALADFCLGQGTCTPEGHRGYVEDLSRLASKVRGDERFTAVAREMPGLVESLQAEYRHELERARGRLRRVEQPAEGDGGLHYRLEQAAREVRSWERSVEDMERWHRWSRELVTALETGDLLSHDPPTTRPAPGREESSP